jgi:hypothetical protein
VLECVFISPLPSNGYPIIESVTSGMFTEPLPSSGHMRHYINNGPQCADAWLGQAVTGLHPSPPRKAGTLTYNVIIRKNSYLLQGNKIIRINL